MLTMFEILEKTTMLTLLSTSDENGKIYTGKDLRPKKLPKDVRERIEEKGFIWGRDMKRWWRTTNGDNCGYLP